MPTDLTLLAHRASYHYSERLCLRPVAITDAWPLWHATRDDRFNAHLLWAQPGREMDVFERVEHMHALARRNQVLTLSCTWRETGRWVGVYRFAPYRDGLETSLWVHPDFWAERGLATEFGRLGLHIGFMETPAPRLYARSLVENQAVHKLMVPSGFVAADRGTLTDEAGRARDFILYAIDRAGHEALGTRMFHEMRYPSAAPRAAGAQQAPAATGASAGAAAPERATAAA